VSDLSSELTGLNAHAQPAGPLPPLTAVDETVTEPSAEAVRTYLSRLGRLRYPVAFDTSGRVADGYGAQDQPWFVLISASGKILWSHDGWLSLPALEVAARRGLQAVGEGDLLGRDERRADLQLDLRVRVQRDVARITRVHLAVVNGHHVPEGRADLIRPERPAAGAGWSVPRVLSGASGSAAAGEPPVRVRVMPTAAPMTTTAPVEASQMRRRRRRACSDRSRAILSLARSRPLFDTWHPFSAG